MKKTSVVLLSLMVAASVTAQSSGLSLSVQQAQEYALEHNRTIANASLDVRKAEAAKWKSIASMLPQFKASADYSDMFGYIMDLGEFKVTMPAYISYGITTSMAFSGGQLLSVGLQNVSKKMSDISLLKSEQEIADQAKTLYCSALVTEETLDLLEESLESLQQLYTMTLKSVEVGTAEQTDADQLFVQVTTMENSIASTRRSMEMVYNSLRLLLNTDPDTELILTDNIDYILDLAAADAVLSDEFDIERNFSYQLAKANAELARKQVAFTGWSNGPSLSIYHQYTKKEYMSNAMTMNMTPPNMLGISLSIPIFTSWSNGSAVRDAKLSYRKQLNTLEETEYSLRTQHDQLVYNLRTALDTYRAQVQNVDVARRVFSNIAKKYEVGTASSMDVTNANSSLITAKSNYVKAILDIMQAQISLEELLNKQ